MSSSPQSKKRKHSNVINQVEYYIYDSHGNKRDCMAFRAILKYTFKLEEDNAEWRDAIWIYNKADQLKWGMSNNEYTYVRTGNDPNSNSSNNNSNNNGNNNGNNRNNRNRNSNPPTKKRKLHHGGKKTRHARKSRTTRRK
jgi:hypothetical protein